jgi:hypothetical protein
MTVVSRLMPVLLLAISVVLFLWGVAGLVEYVLPPIGFGLQNEAFPPGLQFLHFLSILVTGAVFIVGYLARWRHTPFAIVVMYAVLATLCFVETVDFEAFGGGATRFIPMTIEYIAYIGFSTYLFRSSEMRRRFQRAANARADATRRE